MSIIIQFNSPSYKRVPANIPCRSKTVKLEMVPGIEHSDIPVMTEEGSIIDISRNGVFATTLKDVKSSHYCYGLPYQDHNYGAPPPPTPPSYSPCPSPAAVVAIVDEDTNHSVVSTTTEEAPEESVTRCICGFDHDDEYMICCDNCLVWQHVECMGLDRTNIPETYLCEKCEPRKLDKHKAKLLQARKKVVLTKIPPVKQEANANNLVYGKNYKKTLPHSPDKWHQGISNAPPPQRFYGSTDSDEDAKNTERRPKTRSKRRKREDDKDVFTKKGKMLTKHGKERLEIKRTRLRRSTKESTSTADEEAQDAWAYSMEWCEENFESAATNQYTPEVQHLARMLRPQGFEKKFFDQLKSKQCHILDDGKKKQLVSLYDIPRNQPLIEYKGKYLLASQFHDLHPLYNKRLYPYIMFYKVDDTEICVDSSMYGNNARFVRRSCKPNAEMRHMSYNGNLHLFLQSTKVIFSEDEITVPLNFNQCENIKDIVCACGSEDCFLKPKKRNGSVEVCQEKRRRTRRSTISVEDDNSQSMLPVSTPEKVKESPTKPESPEQPVIHSEINERVIEMKVPSDHESEEQSIESKKKMTREQRKIEAYMRAFTQMEKMQRRKKQAMERQKAHHPKSDDLPEKSDPADNAVSVVEEKPPAEPEALEKEESAEDEIKVLPQPAPPKPKKGKRRRGSGTSSRRRTRTNSGGSDILPTLEEVKQIISEPVPDSPPALPPPIPEPVMEPAFVIPPPTSPDILPAEESPYALKTKKLLLHERFKEESERSLSRASASSPRSIHSEIKWNTTANSPTCYVYCTKSNSGSSIAPNLLRSNSSGHLRVVGSPASVSQSRGTGSQGSAKKRWLRQAMHDCPVEPLVMDTSSMEHLDNSCLSPSCHGDVDSPGTSTDDILTPLKKRRLMRESIESLSSPRSPSLENGMYDTDATTSSLTNDTAIDQRLDTMDQQMSVANDNSVQFSPEEEEDSSCKVDAKLEFVLPDLKEASLDNDNVLRTISFEENNTKDAIDSNKPEPFENEVPSMQIDCDTKQQTLSEIKHETYAVNGDISVDVSKTDPTFTLNNDAKSSSEEEDLSDPIQKADSQCISTKILDLPANLALETVPENEKQVAVPLNTVQLLINKVQEAVPVNEVQEAVHVDKVPETVLVNKVLEFVPVNEARATLPINQALDTESLIKAIEAVPLNEEKEAVPLNEEKKTVPLNEEKAVSLNEIIDVVPLNKPLEAVPEAIKNVPLKSVVCINKALEAVPGNIDISVANINSANQSVKAITVKNTDNQIILAQKQTLDSFAADVASSPVNKLSPIDIKCASPTIGLLETSADSKIESSRHKSIEHLSSCETHSSNIESTVQNTPSNEITSSESHSADAEKAMQAVNKDNHSTTDRPPNLTIEEKVCSVKSSFSNIVANSKTVDSHSVPVKKTIEHNEIVHNANGIKTPQMPLVEEETPVKACASATQKRKVSLSEYRMRMRENTIKNRSNSDIGKSKVDGDLGKSEKRPAPITLAPLPLFDLGDSTAKDQRNKKSDGKTKKDSTPIEDSNTDATEHRENLTERLKREFGFDLSEGPTSLNQAKSKSNNQTSDPVPNNSNLNVDPQSLPPPPPPPRGLPRPIRAPQTAMGKVPVSIPSQYGFVHPPFTRPPYIMPQVPGAFIPPPHLPPSAPPPLRPPLTRSFAPSGALLPTPARPVNAQRFANLRQPTHKAYPHAYPSGLYK